jgi:hypothetical protein
MYTAPKNIYRDRVNFAHPPAGRTPFPSSGDSLAARRNSVVASARGRLMSEATAVNSEGC